MKTYTKLVSIAVCIMSINLATAQSTFQELAGMYAYDAHKVVNGTGYVFGGISNKPTAGVRNCYVVRTDINGDTLWTSNWGGVSGACDQQYINDLCPLMDGGVIANGGKGVCNDTINGGAIVRTDATGKVKWAKCFSQDSDPYPCIQGSDGNFISGGYACPAGSWQHCQHLAYLTKIDSATGDTIWSKDYGGTGFYNWFYHIIQTADGGYLAAGRTNSFGAGGDDIYLVKTDANGNLKWSKTYGTSGNEYAFGHCLEATTDKGYILTGQAAGAQGIFLLKVDSLGNISWAKYYDGAWAHGVKQTRDGGYVVTGAKNGSSVDVLLFKTDASGNVLWGKTYGGPSYDEGLILEVASDGGFISGGNAGSFGGGLYIVKSDSNGNSGCNQATVTINSSVAPFIAANAATVVSRGPHTFSYSYLYAQGATVSTLCTTVSVNNMPNNGPQIKVYPNPVADEAKITFSENGDHHIQLMDITGRQVAAYVYRGLEYRLACGSLSPGMYFIKVTQQSQTQIFKFVKQ